LGTQSARREEHCAAVALVLAAFSDVLLKLFINSDQFGGALFHQLLKMVAVSFNSSSALTLSDVAQEHNIFLGFD